MASTFEDPATNLVLGQSAPWIKALEPAEALAMAKTLSYPPMERLAFVWGNRVSPPA